MRNVFLQGIDPDELKREIVAEIIGELRPIIHAPKSSRADDFATRRELAAILRASEATVDRMVKDGCPSLMRGSSRLFVVAEVVEWLRDQTPEAEAAAADRQRAKHDAKNKSTTL